MPQWGETINGNDIWVAITAALKPVFAEAAPPPAPTGRTINNAQISNAQFN
jgi:hypothetical protein